MTPIYSVSPYVKHALGTSLKNPLEFREVFKWLWRVCRETLNPAQVLVAMFIFDRTTAWGREWEVIPLRHFVKGVSGKDGTCYALPVGLSQPVVSAALGFLVHTGVVHRKPKGKGFAYALNYKYLPPTIEQMPEIPIPKRLKGGAQTAPTVKDSFTQTAVSIKDSFIHNSKERINLKRPNSDCVAGVVKSAEAAMQKASTAATMKAGKATPAGRISLFSSLCRAAGHPGVTFTKDDAAILHRYCCRLAKAGISVSDFLRYITQQWESIRTSVFSWMRSSSPSIPSIRFLVRMSDRYEDAYHKYKAQASALEEGGAARDAAFIQISKGVTKDAATKEVKARREMQTLHSANRLGVWERINAARKIKPTEVE